MSQDFATEERVEIEMMIGDSLEHNIVHSEEQPSSNSGHLHLMPEQDNDRMHIVIDSLADDIDDIENESSTRFVQELPEDHYFFDIDEEDDIFTTNVTDESENTNQEFQRFTSLEDLMNNERLKEPITAPVNKSNTSDSNYVRDFFDSFNLFIVPFAATHHTANSSSWLDLCVVDDKDKLIAISQSQAPFVAGHELISISYRWEFENKTCSTKSYRNLSRIDDCTFLSTLRSFNWSCFNQSQSVDNKQSLISEAITSALDEHAPLHNHVIRGKVCPWMNDEIRDLICQRDSAFRAWKRGGNTLTRSNFKKLRNKVKSLVKQARDRYNTDRLKNITDSGKLWKELRRIGIAKDKRDDSPLNFNVNIINDYFLSVCGDSSFNVTPSFISNLLVNYEFNDGLFFFEDICPSTLLKALKSMKTEAQGSDGLSISYIMKGIPVLFPYVLDLFNMSLQTSIFPEDWKRVLIKPIGKVKVPQQPGDYRPIAILSSLSKVLEKVVFYQLNKFVETNDVLSPFQSGYRKGFSTQTLLAGATDDICKAIDQKKVTIVVFFDFSKAFDSVPHTILLSKLKAIGLSGSVIRWFASYLSGRTQAVVGPDGELSEWGHIGTGVPQGSVLGPLLFLLYTNDFRGVLKYSKHMYFVDDLQIYIHSSLEDLQNNIRLINEDVKAVFDWAKVNILKINFNKTYSMIIGSTWYVNKINLSDSSVIKINDNTIPFVDLVKNLGVIFTPTLSWDKQVGKMCKSVYATLSQFKTNKKALTVELKTKLVTSLVFPHFDYCCVVYNDMTEELNYKLEKLLNSCIRFIFDLKRDEHVTPYRLQLGWLSVSNRRLWYIGCLTHGSKM
ncbi:uncharacterized protein LOC122504103 [Leptopilina heterotoma]|uniref:uncharacterized protein LOC122504103 n=1 Tax=Leptopilina heterotoma TaxID=63436 RepID=UPI001CA90E04|nr:uncharacterized protein LOC122504103 [Leptopilina heterotoma]